MPRVAIGGCRLGGRCHLAAEEHLRPSSPEEVGDILSSRIARDDLEKLLNLDPDDPETFDDTEEYAPSEVQDQRDGDPGQELGVQDDEEMAEDMDFAIELEGTWLKLMPFLSVLQLARGESERPHPYGPVQKRVRQKAPQPREHSALTMKRCQTERAQEKALEKALPWRLIPESEHDAFRGAEEKQFKEHLDHQALNPLSVEESLRVQSTVDLSRILTSRFVYRDKRWSRRTLDLEIPWNHYGGFSER